jgi:asparagine synthase (glutamine-hydrolysing)
MVRDVPFGALLSGGIDSLVVAAMMQEASSSPMRTFTKWDLVFLLIDGFVLI